jgi:hypothetical protein
VSTIWTPSGEHRVPKEPGDGQPGPAGGQAAGPQTPASTGAKGPGERGQEPAQSLVSDGAPEDDWEPTPEEARQAKEELDAMRQQLVEAPVELVIANHAMGLWELAALHLSHKPPQLPQAQLAIDALSALLDGLQGRLGDDERSLRDGLAEIRLAFVQIHNADRARQAGQGG